MSRLPRLLRRRLTLLGLAALALLGLACDAPPRPIVTDPIQNVDAGVPGPDSEGGAVAWSDVFENPSTHNLDIDIGLDFGMFHTVELPVPNEPAALLIKSLCSTPAGEETVCQELDRNLAVEGDGAFRWGVDPSQYNRGFNVFEHTLTLRQGDFVLDEATLRFEVTR